MRYIPSAKELAINLVDAGVMYMEDGRELCITDRAYLLRTEALMVRQKGKCAICTRIMGYPTFDHEIGRGSGGSHRDDGLLHPDGTWKNASLCMGCNTIKGSKRYHWIESNTQYVPKQAAA